MEISGVWEGIKKIGRAVAPAFDPRTEYPKIPAEEIDAQQVAQHILDYPPNVLARGDERVTSKPLTRDQILFSMGYQPNWTRGSTDYSTKYPKEYQALNQALRELTDAGILRQEVAEEPNEYGERDEFWVEDIGQLRELAAKHPQDQAGE